MIKEMGYTLMDKEFIELLEKVFPDGAGTTKAYNANEKITEEDRIELSKIGRADYETSCEIMKKLIEKAKGDNETETIPMLYRKAIFFITYKLYHEVKTEGVQSQVLKDLGLAHNTFTKWDMKPIRDYKEGHDWGAEIALERDGKKNEALLFLFDGIVSQVKFKNMVDVFGGLGAVTASRPVRKGTKGYINDFDKSIANLLAAIKYKPKELEELCRQTLDEIDSQEDEKILEKGDDLYTERLRRQYRRYDIAVERDDYKSYPKIEKTIKKLENIEPVELGKIKYAMGLHDKFKNEVTEYQDSKTDEEKVNGFIVDEEKVDINNALACYYLYSFTFKYKPNITGVQPKNLKSFKENVSKISDYSERLKNVQVSCCDFKVIMEDEKINAEDTLLYSDSPYFRTKQYDEGFSDDQHIALHNSLKAFKGKWVFSCRQDVTNNSGYKDKKDGEVKIHSLLEYFEMYADIAKYVAYANNDDTYEIMITNFDFKVPNIETLKSHRAEVRGTKNYKDKYEIDGERGYTKETYGEFLARIRKSFEDTNK